MQKIRIANYVRAKNLIFIFLKKNTINYYFLNTFEFRRKLIYTDPCSSAWIQKAIHKKCDFFYKNFHTKKSKETESIVKVPRN